MLQKNKVAVISSGNGGQAMSAYFAYKGYEVALYVRERARVEMFPTNLFHLTGVVDVEAPVALISCDMRAVVRNAQLIMVTTPSQYHHIIAAEMAPYLQDGQIILLNPGRTFGTCEFQRVLQGCGCVKKVIVAEAETFIFTCRCPEVGKPVIYKIKDHMKIAAHDSSQTEEVLEALSPVFPTVTSAKDILETGFGNMGMIFHPLPVLMNLTRVERQERFLYYQNAISPLVAGMLERMDAERMSVAQALGVQTLPVLEWLRDKYGSTGKNLYECLQNTDAYREVYTPSDINTRYVFEDVPTGCVPMVAIARHLGIDLPITRAVVSWASAIYDRDFYNEGRNETKVDFEALTGRKRASTLSSSAAI